MNWALALKWAQELAQELALALAPALAQDLDWALVLVLDWIVVLDFCCFHLVHACHEVFYATAVLRSTVHYPLAVVSCSVYLLLDP